MNLFTLASSETRTGREEDVIFSLAVVLVVVLGSAPSGASARHTSARALFLLLAPLPPALPQRRLAGRLLSIMVCCLGSPYMLKR